MFALRGIDLTKLESRPIPGRPWEYSSTSTWLRRATRLTCTRALAHLAEFAPMLRTLGSYAQLEDPRGLAARSLRGGLVSDPVESADDRGRIRAPARAMLKAVGFSDADLKKPLIGVANTWIEIGPCNYHLRDLAGAREGRHPSRPAARRWNSTRSSISDGITMGTEGMRASLVSREVIADSIELVTRAATDSTASSILVGCDKTIPAAAMALARLNVPGLVLYGGSIAPGQWHGRAVTIQDVFEAVGAHAAGTLSDGELRKLEDVACPGAGACGGQFTANTMAIVSEFLGIAALGSGSVPATDPAKADIARAAGRAGDGPGARRHQAARHHHAPVARERHRVGRDDRRIDQRRPAPAWRSRTRPASILRSTTSIASARGVPLLADLKPSGRFVATELHAAGGSRSWRSGSSKRRAIDGSAPTVTGRSLEQEAADAVETPGQEVVRAGDIAHEAQRRARHSPRQRSRPTARS